ncbi:sulfotransferase 1A2-like [Lingula anatina]|uniref:Sulfotransferase 1A2-like n=1 Tax=Lingula anatina TaxID=7574 RepID=A0A1S3JUV9_LINAN|nr:sulfotransferase 1A2-like [Lingula anatina]|eukprot:XP_013389205.1 sulfotransferase 1A2-like [Lingula anatina]
MAETLSSPAEAPTATKGIQLIDGSGKPFPALDIDGLMGMAGFKNIEERMKNLPNFVAREDDVWVCASPKCGTHWVWEVVSMILEGKAETIQAEKENLFLEMKDLEDLDKQLSPRVLNTHFPLKWIPTDVFNKRSKLILVIRNPKDAYVSGYHHYYGSKGYYDGSWNDFFELLPQFAMYENHYLNWFGFNKTFWEFSKDHKDTVLVVKYEDMLKDQVGHVRKIADFLGKPIEQSLCEAIAEKCSFKNMKKDKRSLPMAGPEGEKDKEPEKRVWKENAVGMYRKGKAGDWKNHFTVAQNERFDALYEEQMSGCDLSIVFDI